jgi:hypothetical protein
LKIEISDEITFNEAGTAGDENGFHFSSSSAPQATITGLSSLPFRKGSRADKWETNALWCCEFTE